MRAARLPAWRPGPDRLPQDSRATPFSFGFSRCSPPRPFSEGDPPRTLPVQSREWWGWRALLGLPLLVSPQMRTDCIERGASS